MSSHIPLSCADITDSEINAATDALRGERLALGSWTSRFEKSVAQHVGSNFGIATNSAYTAMFITLESLSIGSEDEVITPAFANPWSAACVLQLGATPVFADCDPRSLNMDAKDVGAKITPKTKAIVPVHFTGLMCEMDRISEIADKHDIHIIEDAAQSFGAEYQFQKAGSFSSVAIFSMNPMKVFAACGEAGMVVTDDYETYNWLLSLRYNGTVKKENCIQPSHNARIDTLQAAILLEKIKDLNGIIIRRRAIARLYDDRLRNTVIVPIEKDSEYDVYYTYTIQVENRKELIKHLNMYGIETKIQHPILMPNQQPYQNASCGNISNAKRLVERILCIPANEKMTDEDIHYVSDCIIDFYRS